jgi:nucleoside diphosphate kinase
MTSTNIAGAAVSDVDETALRALTRSEEKVGHYLVDPHFRSGQRLITASAAMARTFVVLKPDALAGRRVGAALDIIRANGFDVLAARTFRFSPLLTREVWRFQFNIASQDRADVVDLLLPSAESLLLVLRDTGWTGPDALPAACRLAGLKGSADPAARRPGDLRTVLRGPTTLFNFMHTADEPADVVRELALFDLVTGPPASTAAQLTAPMPESDLTAAIDRLYDVVPAHDLDAAASRRRLSRYPVRAVADAAGADDYPGWRAVLAAFPGGQPPADALWDLLSLATAEIDCNVPGLRPVIPTIGAAHWTAEGDRR